MNAIRTRITRPLLAALVVILMTLGASTALSAPAQAATTTAATSSQIAGLPLTSSVVFSWSNVTVYLDRTQTNNLGLGSTGVAAALLRVPYAAAAVAVFSGYANWAYNRGACLAIRIYYPTPFRTIPVPTAWHYYGGSCR